MSVSVFHNKYYRMEGSKQEIRKCSKTMLQCMNEKLYHEDSDHLGASRPKFLYENNYSCK